jgi:hypothetical protein
VIPDDAKERRESGQTDLFRARLDQIVKLTHPRRIAAADEDSVAD